MFIGDGAKLVRDAFELAKEKCKDQNKVSFVQFIKCSVPRPHARRIHTGVVCFQKCVSGVCLRPFGVSGNGGFRACTLSGVFHFSSLRTPAAAVNSRLVAIKRSGRQDVEALGLICFGLATASDHAFVLIRAGLSSSLTSWTRSARRGSEGSSRGTGRCSGPCSNSSTSLTVSAATIRSRYRYRKGASYYILLAKFDRPKTRFVRSSNFLPRSSILPQQARVHVFEE